MNGALAEPERMNRILIGQLEEEVPGGSLPCCVESRSESMETGECRECSHESSWFGLDSVN